MHLYNSLAALQMAQEGVDKLQIDRNTCKCNPKKLSKAREETPLLKKAEKLKSVSFACFYTSITSLFFVNNS